MKKAVAVFLLAFFLFSPIAMRQTCFAAGLFDIFNTMSGGPDQEPKYRVTVIEGDRTTEDEILLIRLKGVIRESSEESSGMPFEIRQDMVETFKKDIEVALKRPQVKAVLLEIDSPGGEVTTSDILHHHVTKLKAEKKPVLALIGTLGASGGYYVACAADQIWAHPTSILGSIGVLMQAGNLQKLADIIGYRDVTLKSDRTPKKDILSPFREMTPEERKLLVAMIDSMYDRFIKIVADGRKKKPEEIIPMADGSIYTSDQALKMGLIDGIGYREDVIEKVKAAANLKTAKLVKRRTKKGLGEFFAEMAEMHSGAPAFMAYLEKMLANADTPSLLYQLRTGR